MLIEGVKDGNCNGFLVGRVDLWRGIEDSEGAESHCGLRQRDVRFGIWNWSYTFDDNSGRLQYRVVTFELRLM